MTIRATYVSHFCDFFLIFKSLSKKRDTVLLGEEREARECGARREQRDDERGRGRERRAHVAKTPGSDFALRFLLEKWEKIIFFFCKNQIRCVQACVKCSASKMLDRQIILYSLLYSASLMLSSLYTFPHPRPESRLPSRTPLSFLSCIFIGVVYSSLWLLLPLLL